MDTLLLAGLNNAAWAAALALIVALVARARRHRPALLHALWLLVLLKLVTPSLVHVDANAWTAIPKVEGPPSMSKALDPARRGSHDPAVTDDRMSPNQPAPPTAVLDRPMDARENRRWEWPWRAIVAGCWLAGSILWCSAVAAGMFRFRRLIRSARPAPADLRIRIERMAARLDLRRIPATYVVPAQVPPMLWALVGPPRLILPHDLWDRLGDDERDAILAHELAHLKRRDEWARRLEAVAMVFFWWNPVAWWARREVERTEEQCCDAWVLWALPGAGRAYARALVRTAEFLSDSKSRHPRLAGASGAGHFSSLKRRLAMILDHDDVGAMPKPRKTSRILLALAGLTLLLLPAWAISGPPKPAVGQKILTVKLDGVPLALSVPPRAEPSPESLKAALEDFKARYGNYPPGRVENTKDPVAAGTLGRAYAFMLGAESTKAPAKAGPAESPPVLDAPPEIAQKVKFVQVTSAEVRDHEVYTGRIASDHPVAIKLPLTGHYTTHCETGSLVKKGDLLFEVDPEGSKGYLKDREHDLQNAEAELEEAVSKWKNAEELQRQKAISLKQVEDAAFRKKMAEGRVKQSRGNVEAARRRLTSSRVTAPLRGIVELVKDVIGSEAGITIATISSTDPMFIEFDLAESTFLKLRRQKIATGKASALDLGSKVEVTLGADHSLKYEGKMASVANQIDTTRGTIHCRASIPNTDGLLIPGLSASVKLFTSEPHKVLLARDAGRLGNSRTGVYVVNQDDELGGRMATFGQAHPGGVIVKDGLKEGDWFVIAGEELVKPGMKVKRSR